MHSPIQRHPAGGLQINLGKLFFWDFRQGYIRAFGKVRRWGRLR